MRNIEDIAAEEGARERQEVLGRLRTLALLLAAASGAWGWFLFQKGQMTTGTFWILPSLALFFVAWGGLKVLPNNPFAAGAGLGLGVGAYLLYHFTRVPFFYWGQDPAFCLSVHGGAVGEPPWSPLAFLVGQATTGLFSKRPFFMLPEASCLALAIAFFFSVQDLFQHVRNQTYLNLALSTLSCACAALCLPLWNAGTMASGLIMGLGLLLFLFQRILLTLEERPWNALYFLLGLLMSVHPLWGVLGLFVHLTSLDTEGEMNRGKIFPLFLGFTPYLWVLFRSGRAFPSWGGDHPFLEMFSQWKTLWTRHFHQDWSAGGALGVLGWLGTALVLLMILLAFFYLAQWRSGTKRTFSILEIWAWILAGLGGFFFYSGSSEELGCTAAWFLLGTSGYFLRLAERGIEKKHGGWAAGSRLAGLASLGLVATLPLLALPGQRCLRSDFFFPQQHAMNLLSVLDKRSILVTEDRFEGAACQVARLQEPTPPTAMVLDQGNLNQRWYLSQCIANSPELLFSKSTGPTDELLKTLVQDNHEDWTIHWSRSELPADWNGVKAHSTVLTQKFEGRAASADPMGFQYRYDLTFLPLEGTFSDGLTARYLARYSKGFLEMGKDLYGAQRYTDAIHCFERAEKVDPSAKEPGEWLARIYSQKNILEAARLEFERLVKAGPGRGQALMEAIDRAKKIPDDAKAALLLDELVRLNTAVAGAQYQLSKIYDRQGRSQESKALLEESVRSNPQQLEAQMSLGHLMARLGNRARAQEAFRAVLELDPQNKEAQVELWKLLNR